MTEENNDILAKDSNNFYCQVCNYKTNRKYNFNSHMNSDKHKNKILGKTVKIYKCKNCEKEFNDRAGLWRHNKKCIQNENKLSNNEHELIIALVKENIELKNISSKLTNSLNL